MALVGALWWWRRRDAAMKASPAGLATSGAVAALMGAQSGAQAQAATNSPIVRRTTPLDPVGLGTVPPPAIVNNATGTATPGAPATPTTTPKVDSGKPWPPKPTAACPNGWKLTKVSVGKSVSYPSGAYNQWQCR